MEPLTVTQLTGMIRHELQTKFQLVTVKGEISNYKLHTSGHTYFTLKDAGAQIAAVLYKGTPLKLPRSPREGEAVILRGELSVYPPRGSYQITVRSIEIAGVGDLLLQLHERKAKLEAKGFFSPARKRRLPRFPERIGVITSPTGAVIQDILHVLRRRSPGFHLLLNPVRVQGAGSAEEIAQAIDVMNAHGLCDLLILARGGGSLEDLWAFNEECVAEAIFRSKIPLISAVGHETDFTIADFVADVRAPTPSAAAELAVSEKSRELTHLSQVRERAHGILSHGIVTARQMVDEGTELLLERWQRQLERKKERSLGLSQQIALLQPQARLEKSRKELAARREGLESATRRLLHDQRTKLRHLAEQLRGVDPRQLLQRGFCLLFSEKEGSLIVKSSGISPGEKLRIQMSDGALRAEVLTS